MAKFRHHDIHIHSMFQNKELWLRLCLEVIKNWKSNCAWLVCLWLKQLNTLCKWIIDKETSNPTLWLNEREEIISPISSHYRMTELKNLQSRLTNYGPHPIQLAAGKQQVGHSIILKKNRRNLILQGWLYMSLLYHFWFHQSLYNKLYLRTASLNKNCYSEKIKVLVSLDNCKISVWITISSKSLGYLMPLCTNKMRLKTVIFDKYQNWGN